MMQTVRSPTPSDPSPTPFRPPMTALELLLGNLYFNLRPFRHFSGKNREVCIKFL